VLKPPRTDASMILDKDCGKNYLIWAYRLKRERKVDEIVSRGSRLLLSLSKSVSVVNCRGIQKTDSS